MSSIAIVLGFSWAYIRRYWVRLVASILLGLVFALANASFMWAAQALAVRWELREKSEPKEKNDTASKLPEEISRLRQQAEQWSKELETKIDPWLPRIHETLNW